LDSLKTRKGPFFIFLTIMQCTIIKSYLFKINLKVNYPKFYFSDYTFFFLIFYESGAKEQKW